MKKITLLVLSLLLSFNSFSQEFGGVIQDRKFGTTAKLVCVQKEEEKCLKAHIEYYYPQAQKTEYSPEFIPTEAAFKSALEKFNKLFSFDLVFLYSLSYFTVKSIVLSRHHNALFWGLVVLPLGLALDVVKAPLVLSTWAIKETVAAVKLDRQFRMFKHMLDAKNKNKIMRVSTRKLNFQRLILNHYQMIKP